MIDSGRHRTLEPVTRVGTASALVHHGEILQGMFRDDHGRLRRGLLSMPCDLFSTRAVFTSTPGSSVVVEPCSRTKAARAARETLAILGRPSVGGRLELLGDVPLSRGFGSSTSDVVATIRAVQDAFGAALPDDVVARIATRAETASDPLMFSGRTVLFAHRDGEIIENFGARLPLLAVIGFSTSRSGDGVDTLELAPANYRRGEIRRFAELREMVRTALLTGDVRLLGSVVTESTAINQRHLPMGPFDVLRSLIDRVGAVGLQTAHSGDIAGLLFDGSCPDTEARQDRAAVLLREAGITHMWRFTAGGMA
jgi:uncharacterized protein involved in propanediol utilization